MEFFKQVDDLRQLDDPAFLRFEFIFACAYLLILALRLWIMRGADLCIAAIHPNLATGRGKTGALRHVYGFDGHCCHRAGHRGSFHAWDARRGAHLLIYRGA